MYHNQVRLELAETVSRWRCAIVLQCFSGFGVVRQSISMDRQNTTRILLEGALNGIGFVIGSALVGLIVSIFLIIAHHLTMLIALPIIGIVLWVSFKGRRLVKARRDRAKMEEFTRA